MPHLEQERLSILKYPSRPQFYMGSMLRIFNFLWLFYISFKDHCGRERMVVGFTIAYAIRAYNL